jgi:ABC-2 type transport system permease protein
VENREKGVEMLTKGRADAMVVLPQNLSRRLLNPEITTGSIPTIELVGDITDLKYIVGAVWTEELVNRFILEASGISLPLEWKETTLGHSGQRTEFELYVPGLMIFAIIMMLFTASASIVREPESGTLERLKISSLNAMQYLVGISLIQVIIGILSLLLTIGTAISLGYEVIPGSFGFILVVGFLTSLSMISFSLIVAAICRSIKDVAIIGTFPLLLLMFFSGAFFPLGGGRIATIGNFTFHLNDLLSPTWAVDALNKVLIKGMDAWQTLPELGAILVLTILYFFIGVWAFRRRHMRAA